MAEGRRQPGEILGLLDLIEEHPAALQYDFRARFPGVNGGIEGVPGEMGWGEAINLVEILRADPSSMLAAALEGWTHPISREALVLMDLFDLEHTVNAKKQPKPHPGRPWKDESGTETIRRGNTRGRTRDEVVEILAGFGHPAPV